MGDDDIRLPAPFAFKGERPYINAATMMEHLLPALRREFPGADAPTPGYSGTRSPTYSRCDATHVANCSSSSV